MSLCRNFQYKSCSAMSNGRLKIWNLRYRQFSANSARRSPIQVLTGLNIGALFDQKSWFFQRLAINAIKFRHGSLRFHSADVEKSLNWPKVVERPTQHTPRPLAERLLLAPHPPCTSTLPPQLETTRTNPSHWRIPYAALIMVTNIKYIYRAALLSCRCMN